MENGEYGAATLTIFTMGGTLVGFLVGVAVTCLLSVAKRADEWTEEFQSKNGPTTRD